jgi:hypothetical protein
MQNSRVGRQTFSQRVAKHQVSILRFIVLVIALSVVPSSVVQAQVRCLGLCEEQLATCGGDSGPCQDTYESCVNSCLGGFAALLG